jgi:hypothetical protein
VQGWGGEGRWWGKGGEMTQTLYAHMNKIKIIKNKKKVKFKRKKQPFIL